MKNVFTGLPRQVAPAGRYWRHLLIALLVVGFIFFIIVRARVNYYTRSLAEDISSLYHDDIVVTVRINETIPLNLEVPLGEMLDLSGLLPSEIPIDTSVPIETSVRINQVIRVPVNLPLVGATIIDLPIDTTVPFEQEIPISTTFQYDPSTFPSGPDLTVSLEKDIRIDIPVSVAISPAELGLGDSMDSIVGLINTLRLVFLLRGVPPASAEAG